MALCPRLLGFGGTRKVKPIWILLAIFYWSKRQWVAVASAGPYASLHLTPDRQITIASTPPLSFLQAGCPSCRPTNSVTALKATDRSTKKQKYWIIITFFKAKSVLQKTTEIPVQYKYTYMWKLNGKKIQHMDFTWYVSSDRIVITTSTTQNRNSNYARSQDNCRVHKGRVHQAKKKQNFNPFSTTWQQEALLLQMDCATRRVSRILANCCITVYVQLVQQVQKKSK